MTDREAKQVIVMRTDLNMRKGKMIAQGAHASIAFLTKFGENVHLDVDDSHPSYPLRSEWVLETVLTPPQVAWIKGSFVKICVGIDSEQGLYDIATKAGEAGLEVTLIKDQGRTEFGGVETFTCCAIGPNWAEDVDAITGDLKLL